MTTITLNNTEFASVERQRPAGENFTHVIVKLSGDRSFEATVNSEGSLTFDDEIGNVTPDQIKSVMRKPMQHAEMRR